MEPKKCKNLSLKIVGNNCAGLKGKKDSFENLLKIFSPAIVMLQETKLYKRGTMKFENFQCFEKIRNEKEGGGLMTLVHKNFDPVVIPTKKAIKNESKYTHSRSKDKKYECEVYKCIRSTGSCI